MKENIVFICTIICNQTATLSHFRRMQPQIKHTYRGSNQGISSIRTSEKPQNIHSDEAAAATNQSTEKAVLEATRLQDVLP